MKENTNLVDKCTRLNKAIAHLKGVEIIKTQKDIAKTGIIAASNLSRAINCDEKYLTDSFLEKFANEFSLNKKWLLIGEGDITTIDNVATDAAKIISKKKKLTNGITPMPQDGYMMVEYQDLSVAAGKMGGANPDLLPETKTRLVPREYETGNYLVVRVDGDSMDDGSKFSIPDGCEILIKEYPYEQGEVLPIRNNLFVIVTREGTVLKQVVKHDTMNDTLTLHSFNPNYKDYTVHFEDILQIFIYRKITSNRPPIPDIT